MKNIFDFATNELSQDAILCWLFANHNCEDESVKKTCKALFDSFTAGSGLCFEKISAVKIEKQWKHIDVSIWFKIESEDYLIVIEDKTTSHEHEQLNIYNNAIAEHNTWWIANGNAYQETITREDMRFITDNTHIFKIFFKTDIIDEAESARIKKNNWKKYDIYSIYKLLQRIIPTNDLLKYYLEHIQKIYDSAARKTKPSEWDLLAWHAFFHSYVPCDNISSHKEIGSFQRAYYYIKLFVKDHNNDMPCFEIRSRDFSFDGKQLNFKVLAVLYNLKSTASDEMIASWQNSLKNAGFKLNYRNKNLKQIGVLSIENIDNTEEAIKNAFDNIGYILSSTFN